jgi:hypothetical protein
MVVAAAVLASPARADHTSLHFTATGDVSVTDNLFATDTDRQADALFTVRPGVLYAWDSPRMIHDFTAELEAIEYLLHNDQPSLNGHAGWRAVILPGPRSSVTMSIDAGHGVVTSLSSATTSDQTTATVNPSSPTGNVTTDQASAAESATYQTTEHTRVTQGVLGRYATTDDGAGTTTDTREVGGNLGFERMFDHDTLLLTAGVSYLRLARKAPPALTQIDGVLGTGTDHQLNPSVSLAWHHDFDRHWALAVNGGVTEIIPVANDPNDPNATHKESTFYTGGANLGYTEVWGRAALAAERSVAPNLLLAENTVDNSVNMTLAMPLPWLDDTRRNPKLTANASIGYSNQQLIDTGTGKSVGNINVGHLDVSVGWTPKPGETFGLRYEFLYQRSGAVGETVMVDGQAIQQVPNYFRNTLSFTFALRIPDRVAGEVPKKGKSIRSDRSDLVPVGAEPVVTDPLEGGDQDDAPKY